MTNLERLKLELNNKNYYTDVEYNVFLEENGLTPTTIYNKKNNQIELLKTIVAVLETLSNDTDIMRKIDIKDITSIDAASKYLENRISKINLKIIELEELNMVRTNVIPIFFN